MAKRSMAIRCPDCGAYLDCNERCDCERIESERREAKRRQNASKLLRMNEEAYERGMEEYLYG